MKDPITLLIGYEQGKKVCEIDITGYSDGEVAETILAQEMQGRKWGYAYTSKEKMRAEREQRDLWIREV